MRQCNVGEAELTAALGALQAGSKESIFSKAKRFLCRRSTLVLVGLWVVFGLLVWYAQVRFETRPEPFELGTLLLAADAPTFVVRLGHGSIGDFLELS